MAKVSGDPIGRMVGRLLDPQCGRAGAAAAAPDRRATPLFELGRRPAAAGDVGRRLANLEAAVNTLLDRLPAAS